MVRLRASRARSDLDGAGRRPVPFQQFVVKLHSRCNIACDYCYLYEMGDSTWRTRPKLMAPAVIERVARRIAEHARHHGLRRVEVILHGGEPLLAGGDAIDSAATVLREALAPDVALTIALQTNGTLIDEEFLTVARRHRIRVTVSLDGEAGTHDLHRRTATGRGTHAATLTGLELLTRPQYRDLFGGLLCVIDLAMPPVAAYAALARHRPPCVDFLLPHGNWTDPPPGRLPDGTATPYADWLITLFDHWYAERPPQTRIRFFENILDPLLGGQSRTEHLGLSPVALIVVDTDGSLEQVDTLRSAYHGAAGTGMNVFTHTFDEALGHPDVAIRQAGLAGLAPACTGCAVRQVCGGGYYPHRYREGDGFANPSVYCADLYRTITHVSRRVHADLARVVEARR
jgi:uncharacterized protein